MGKGEQICQEKLNLLIGLSRRNVEPVEGRIRNVEIVMVLESTSRLTISLYLNYRMARK